MPPDAGSTGPPRADSRPLRSGAIAGAVAWVAGLGITTVLGLTGASIVAAIIVGLAPVAGAISAHLYFHAWPVLGPAPWGTAAFTAVPAGLLLGAGYLVASRSDAPGLRAGFEAGASVTAGYLPAVVASVGVAYLAVVVRQGVRGGLFQGAGGIAVSAAVAGLVFPVAFGGIGGILGSRT